MSKNRKKVVKNKNPNNNNNNNNNNKQLKYLTVLNYNLKSWIINNNL